MSENAKILVIGVVNGTHRCLAVLREYSDVAPTQKFKFGVISMDRSLQKQYILSCKELATNKRAQKIRLRTEDLVDALLHGNWMCAERSYVSLQKAQGNRGEVTIDVRTNDWKPIYERCE